ncbi:MAG: hypothetical protein WCE40_13295 [Polyangia bacterium]
MRERQSVLSDGHVPQYGARPLGRAIDEHVIGPLAMLLSSEVVRGPAEILIGGAPPEARVVFNKSTGTNWARYRLVG